MNKEYGVTTLMLELYSDQGQVHNTDMDDLALMTNEGELAYKISTTSYKRVTKEEIDEATTKAGYDGGFFEMVEAYKAEITKFSKRRGQ